MSDFIPVLAAGLVLLAILFIFFGGIQIVPTQPPHRGGFGEEEISSPPPVSGTIGFPQESIRYIPIASDFSVSFESGEKAVAALRNSSVENGVFGKVDRQVSFDVPDQQDISSARIKFNVTNTNLYGNLVVSVNGETLFNNYSLIGKAEVPVNISRLKPENNILRLEASSSSWRIWAPTAYVFDADALINYYSLKSKSFDFLLDGGMQTISGGRLVLTISKKEGSGNLIASVNGVEIYRGNDSRLIVADFPATYLAQGKSNALQLFSEKGAKYDISSAEILLFYQPVFKTQLLYYNLTSGQYREFDSKNVSLGFGIRKISGDVVSILIKVTDGAGGTHGIIPQGILREGKSYNVTLTKGDLYTGSNRIEFVTSGTGYVNIENVTIGSSAAALSSPSQGSNASVIQGW
jgi:hypothetical protein